MNFNGFNQYFNDGQFILELIMPSELRDVFQAVLYGRGKLMDEAEGEPSQIWNNLSYKYNNIGLVAPHQVHDTNIIASKSEYSLPIRPDADGAFIDETSDSLASLRFADCAPVIVAGVDPSPWMLILHSGFVGTVKNITLNSLNHLPWEFREHPSLNLWAWIGPCICRKCYFRQKNDPVTRSAMKIFSEVNFYENEDYIYFDIKGQIKEQLMQCGLSYDNIYAFDGCTRCNNDIFYSYRGGDKNRRNFLLAGNTTK